MFPPVVGSDGRERKRLLDILSKLSAQDRSNLLAFAEFLLARTGESENDSETRGSVPEPKSLARPARESVVAAMRRLSKTYFMLEKSLVLHEASALMGAHVMQGRPAKEVIDDLETLFRKAYDRYLEQQQD